MKPDSKFNGCFVQGAGGTRLFVEEIGDRNRPSILLLHAYCQCRLSWDRQFESDLTKHFHLVRMDLRGHGLSDKPSDPEAFNNRAFVRLMTGQFGAAIADYDIALQLKPRNAEALFGRGTAKERLGDPAGATDIAAAKAINANIAQDMARVGVR